MMRQKVFLTTLVVVRDRGRHSEVVYDEQELEQMCPFQEMNRQFYWLFELVALFHQVLNELLRFHRN